MQAERKADEQGVDYSPESYVGELGGNARKVRDELFGLLEAVDSEESARGALSLAKKAIDDGDISPEGLAVMIREIPLDAMAHVLLESEADSLLPPDDITTAGISEYEIEDRRLNGDVEPGILNRVYKSQRPRAA
ncbi:MAG: hypothetical protein OEY44_02955 [Candidatus Peregrinibacteria bacterium]|nr:hypothetical protein [Candidatus Peregrinibacteria bacterium]